MQWINRESLEVLVLLVEPEKENAPIAAAAKASFYISCPVCEWSRRVSIGFTTKKLHYSKLEQFVMYVLPRAEKLWEKKVARFARRNVTCEQCGCIGKLAPNDTQALYERLVTLVDQTKYEEALQGVGVVIVGDENACYFEPSLPIRNNSVLVTS